jgi:hypothetical protein
MANKSFFFSLIQSAVNGSATDKQMELRVIYDKVFKEVFEVVL